MKTLSLISIIIFAGWGLGVVRHDLATNKITNAGMKTGMKLLAAVLAVMGAYSLCGYVGWVQDYLRSGFYYAYLAHILWSVLAGVILWYVEFWPAGDAKFFMLISAALPLASPAPAGRTDYVFLTLLINIFVTATLWVICRYLHSFLTSFFRPGFFPSLLEEVKSRLAAADLKKNVPVLAGYLCGMTAVFLLQQTFFVESGGFVSRFFSRVDLLFFFVFVLWGKLRAVFGSGRFTYITAFFCLLYIGLGFFYFKEIMLDSLEASFRNVMLFAVALFFGRLLVNYILENRDRYYLPLSELEPGMVLSARSVCTFRMTKGLASYFEDCFKDGLTEEQVVELKTWAKTNPEFGKEVELMRGKAFAGWIFAGAVITLLLKRNLVGLVMYP